MSAAIKVFELPLAFPAIHQFSHCVLSFQALASSTMSSWGRLSQGGQPEVARSATLNCVSVHRDTLVSSVSPAPPAITVTPPVVAPMPGACPATATVTLIPVMSTQVSSFSFIQSCLVYPFFDNSVFGNLHAFVWGYNVYYFINKCFMFLDTILGTH